MRSKGWNWRGGLALTVAAALCGCGAETAPQNAAPRQVSITSTKAATRPVEVLEESVGYIDTLTAPLVAAEVTGRLVEVRVDVGQTV
jgi:multidrug efflux pump subunit AcrA (membrane-fusion protein)